MSHTIDLSGRVAVVTGGARGQGRSHAVTLAEAGADIAVCDALHPWSTIPNTFPDESDLAETVKMIEALDRRCVSMRADVTKAADMQAFVAEAVDKLGRIDFVVANAGIWAPKGPCWEISEEEWDQMVDVDLKGVWLTCKYTFPHLLERGGSVVLTSSMAGIRGYHNAGHYVAAKHGVVGLMKTLANEGAPYNIRVNSIMPGTVKTQMNNMQVQYDLISPENPTQEGMYAVLETTMPLPGICTEPSDQSAAVLWLCSDESRYVSGAGIPVAGGQNLNY
jgi:(+)-trans-carveol dehydrogenase